MELYLPAVLAFTICFVDKWAGWMKKKYLKRPMYLMQDLLGCLDSYLT